MAKEHIGKLGPRGGPIATLVGNMVKETSNRITKKVYKIFHQLNCKSKFCIYLLECTKCNNRPYVRKFETYWNEGINNHQTDAKKTDSVPVDLPFNQPGLGFTRHNKFTFIEQVTKWNLF